MQLRKAVEIPRRHVLSVLDAPAPVARTVVFLDLLVQIQHGRDGGIADGVSANLQVGRIGAHASARRVRDSGSMSLNSRPRLPGSSVKGSKK